MQQLNYQTVFQIGFFSFPWLSFLPFGLLLAIGCIMIRFQGGKQIRGVVGWVMSVLMSLFMLILGVNLVSEFFAARQAYARNDSSVVEGTVENFQPMPSLGSANESFSVNGTPFSYNVLDSTPCFQNSRATPLS
jgi:hypothetical protein